MGHFLYMRLKFFYGFEGRVEQVFDLGKVHAWLNCLGN